MAEEKPIQKHVKEDGHLLVSVMPKEFRGKEGLILSSLNVRNKGAAPPPREVPKKAEPPVKKVTPKAAVNAKITPPKVKKKKPFPVVPVVVGAVVIVGFAVGAYFIVGGLSDNGEEVVTPTPPPSVPVVVTPPVVVPEEPVEVEPSVPLSLFGEGIYPGNDADSDGLTDVEEELYGTTPTRPDTDGDGFLDGNEVFHLYHPNGREPLKLIDTGFISVLDQPEINYSLNVITSWAMRVNGPAQQVTLTAPSGERFEVLARSIDPVDTIQEWYLEQTPVTLRVELESFTTKRGFTGAWTEDHLTAYVRFDDDTILVFDYNLADKVRVEYRQTFEMFINSLELAGLTDTP